MSRGQIAILLAFVVLVAGLAFLVGPALLSGRPDRTRRVDARGVAPAPSDPEPAAVGPAPAPVGPVAASSRAFRLEVTGPDGRPVPAASRRHVGAVEGADGARLLAARAWVGAPGARWAAVPAPGADGVARVSLVASAPPLTIVLLEEDGAPAAGVPVAWPGPDGRPRSVRTDDRGIAVIDDRAPGVVFIKAGGLERAGPTLRRRAGVDRDASATLDPPWTVAGRVLDASGRPVAGARVRGVWPEGTEDAGPLNAVTDAGGAFRWRGRASDRLALVIEHPVHGTVSVEPLAPDPRRGDATSVEARFPPDASRLAVVTDLSRLAPSAEAILRAEPGVLALVRETWGSAVVAWDAPESSVRSGETWEVADVVPTVPLRVTLRGDVVPEDHVLAPGDPSRAHLVLAPRPLAPEAKAPEVPDAAATAFLRGTVVDPDGLALPGVTVVGGGRRVVADAAGRFAIEGLVPGERIDVLYAWLDGADAGEVDAGAYAPWATARLAPVPDPVVLRLPRAAAVTFLASDGLDRIPLAWVRVVITDGAGTPLFDDVVATRAGRATITGLVPGLPGTLFVHAPGLRREVPLALRAGSTVDLGEVPLVRGGRVEGVVKSPDGRPVARAVVAATDDGRATTDASAAAREADLSTRRTTTDEEGRFVLEGLDATRPTALAVWAEGHAPSARRVLWPEDGRARLNVTLVRGVTARLHLNERGGAPVSGALVEFADGRTGARVLDLLHRAAWGSVVGSTEDVRRAARALLIEHPSEPGLYLVGPLEPGPYDVAIEHPLYRSLRARYTVLDPSPEGPDNPMRIPLESMEWRVELDPARDPGR
ncbi:MAG TPA: carboxypeptidase-like regulatory domain-containing protein [Planctomycetota bacterium]|nr:carboxypeptidase-like regulatory domain-containing protein [Planctomycetota bacterium]